MARIVWLNYPHNPTGQDLPAELFEAWVAARDEHGFILCSDECYTEIYFGEPPRSLLEFGRKGCLAFHSLSKRSGMTGYRAGIIAGDPELIATYRAQRAGFGQANPVFVEAAAAAAWQDEAHVIERRAIFGMKRDVMMRGLQELGLQVYPTSSHVLPLGEHASRGERRFVRLPAHAARDRRQPGLVFGQGNDGFFRVALVPSVAGCEEALERWKEL